MQMYASESRVGQALTLRVLGEHVGERLMRLLLTEGIEIEVAAIQADAVKLVVRAPGEILLVEEACGT